MQNQRYRQSLPVVVQNLMRDVEDLKSKFFGARAYHLALATWLEYNVAETRMRARKLGVYTIPSRIVRNSMLAQASTSFCKELRLSNQDSALASQTIKLIQQVMSDLRDRTRHYRTGPQPPRRMPRLEIASIRNVDRLEQNRGDDEVQEVVVPEDVENEVDGGNADQ